MSLVNFAFEPAKRRKHKDWGGAQRNPRINWIDREEPAKRSPIYQGFLSWFVM